MSKTRMPPAAVRALVGHPALPARDRSAVERFVEGLEAFADLERAILGEILYDVPVHTVDVPLEPGPARSSAAERLGAEVRSLLGLEFPVEGLTRAVEEHGARVLRLPLENDVLGAFVFAGETAPAFLVNARFVSGGARHALAHLYAHYLLDNDPFEPTVCRATGRGAADARRESRADAFAAALLTPRSELSSLVSGGADPASLARHVGLPLSLIGARLQDVAGAEGAARHDGGDWLLRRAQVRPSERLVRLALEGMHAGKIGIDDVARVLGVEPEQAIGLLRLSAAPDEDEGVG